MYTQDQIEQLRDALKKFFPEVEREADYLTNQEVIMYASGIGFILSMAKEQK